MWTADDVAARVPLEVLDHLRAVTVGKGGKFGGLGFEEKLAITSVKIPIPGPEALRRLLETAFDASLTYDEGRSCTMLLRYRPPGSDHRFTAFDEPHELSVEMLRRLSPAVGTDRASSLLFTTDGAELSLVGLDLTSKADLQKAFAVRVTGPGRVDIEWASARIVTCRPTGVQYASDSDVFTGAFAAELAETLRMSEAIPQLGVSVERIRDAGHGGSIWVLPPNCEPSHSALNVGYPMRTNGALVEDHSNGTAERGAVERGAVERLEDADEQRRIAHLHLLADVASLDGGGRHRSAAAFCRKHVGGMAVVISQDGGISVFAHVKKQQSPVLFEITDLGTRWSSGTEVS